MLGLPGPFLAAKPRSQVAARLGGWGRDPSSIGFAATRTLDLDGVGACLFVCLSVTSLGRHQFLAPRGLAMPSKSIPRSVSVGHGRPNSRSELVVLTCYHEVAFTSAEHVCRIWSGVGQIWASPRSGRSERDGWHGHRARAGPARRGLVEVEERLRGGRGHVEGCLRRPGEAEELRRQPLEGARSGHEDPLPPCSIRLEQARHEPGVGTRQRKFGDR